MMNLLFGEESPEQTESQQVEASFPEMPSALLWDYINEVFFLVCLFVCFLNLSLLAIII